MEDILKREVELKRAHEAILQERDNLLQSLEPATHRRDTSRFPEAPLSSKVLSSDKKLRKLLEAVKAERQQLRDAHRSETKASIKLNRLKKNYWTMVRSVFDVWKVELGEYDARRSMTGSGT